MSGWATETQAANFTAADGAAGDALGSAVAMSSDGSTVVAGTPAATIGTNTYQGAAYVFTTKPVSGWATETQAAKLTATDGATNNYLGYSLAVSSDGSTVVAGAPFNQWGPSVYEGAAYVSAKPGSGWANETQTAKLTASDTAGDEVGRSVAVSSDGTLVVAGAPFTKVGSNIEQGAAYEFAKPGSGWSSETQTATLTASNGAAVDELGWSLGVSSNVSTVVGGAPYAQVGSTAEGGALRVQFASRDSVAVRECAGDGDERQRDHALVDLGLLVGWLIADGLDHLHGVRSAGHGADRLHQRWNDSRDRDRLWRRHIPPLGGVHPQAAGDYWWYASYGGDSNNAQAVSACGASMAETVVAPSGGGGNPLATPSLSVSAPASATSSNAITLVDLGAGVGWLIADGLDHLTVFGPQATAPTGCTSGGTTVGTATIYSGDGTYHPSAGFTPQAEGDYWWYASYGGSSNNTQAVSACGASMTRDRGRSEHWRRR